MAVLGPHREAGRDSSRNLSAWRSALIPSRDRATRSTRRHGRRLPRGHGRAGGAHQMNQPSQSLYLKVGCVSPARILREQHHRLQASCGSRRPGARPGPRHRTAQSTSQQSSTSATHIIRLLIPCRRAFPVTASRPGGRVNQARSRAYLVLSTRLLTGSSRTLPLYLEHSEAL